MADQLKIFILGDASNADEAFGQVRAAAAQTVTAIAASVAAGAAAFAALSTSVFKAGTAFDGIRSSMDVSASSMDFVRAEAERLGLDLIKTASDYSKLTAASMGSSLQGEATNKIFSAAATAARALSLSGEQTTGMLKAFEQMISKGNVQAEELRGQLGERLPGAFNMAAEALGVTTSELNKMLDRGEVTAADLLPKLADLMQNRFATAAEKMAQRGGAAWARLNTDVTNFKVTISDSGAYDAMTNVLNKLHIELGDNSDAVRQLAGDLSNALLTAMESGVTGVAMFAKGITMLKAPVDVTRLAIDAVALNVLQLADGYYAAIQAVKEMSISLHGSNPALDAQMQKLAATRQSLGNLIEGVKQTGAKTLDSVLGSDAEIAAKGAKIDAMAQKFFTAIEKARKSSADAAAVTPPVLSTSGSPSTSPTPNATTSSPTTHSSVPSAADIQAEAQRIANEQQQLAALAIERERANALQKIALKRETFNQMKQLGQISSQEELTAQQALARETLQIDLKAARDNAALIKDKPIEYQKAMDKIAEIQRKHDLEMRKAQTQMAAIKHKHNLELKKEQQKLANDQKKFFDSIFSPITKAFEKSVTGMIQGTLSFRKAMKQMGQSIVLEFANMGVKMVVEWVKNEAVKTAATAAGTAQRTGIEQSGAAMSLLISAGTAVKQIMMAAWQVMANVYNAIAAIPVVGPFLAPVAAAGAFGVVANYASNIASASGGYDIPAGINPMTQLHQQEMVLPAHIANPLRDMIAGGQQAGSSTTINVHAMDARSFKQYLTKNASSLPPALKKLKRNFSG